MAQFGAPVQNIASASRFRVARAECGIGGTTGKSLIRTVGSLVKPPLRKYSDCQNVTLRRITPPARTATRDVSRSSRSVVRVAMDAGWRQVTFTGRNAGRVRRNRVVLAPRPWRYLREVSSRTTGARKAVPREERDISRKAIARGKPGCPGCTCGSTRVHFS